MHIEKLGISLLVSLIMVGCTVGPKYQQPPELCLSEGWHQSPSDGMNAEDPACFVWWEALNDPILNCLMQKAAQQNLDLFIAGTRILEARREQKGKSSNLYPHIDASVTTGHLYYSKDALVNGILKKAIPSHNLKHAHRNVNFFEMGFDASWELDLFGAVQHQMDASQAKVESTEENLKDVWITLSAEIAKNYIELRSLQQRLLILSKNILTQTDSYDLTTELLRIGVVDRSTLLKVENQLHSLKAEKPQLDLAIAKSIHRLSILIGQSPGDLFAELSIPNGLPKLPYEKPIGLPSELLRRRPDIRKAERDLAASTEMVGSAVADMFPRISLLGFIGSISTQLKSLASAASGTWFAAPQLLLPIFNSSLLTQDVDLAKIQNQQALFTYQKTVLEALEEVENNLAAFRSELERHQYLSQSQIVAEEDLQLISDLHRRGIKDYLEVQNATQALLSAQAQVIQNNTQLLFNYISLYKSLGGVWNINEWVNPSCAETNICSNSSP